MIYHQLSVYWKVIDEIIIGVIDFTQKSLEKYLNKNSDMNTTVISLSRLSKKTIAELKRIIDAYKSHNKIGNESSTIDYLGRTYYGQTFNFGNWCRIQFTSKGLQLTQDGDMQKFIISKAELMKMYSAQQSLF